MEKIVDDKNALRSKEREFIVDCIHLYRELPALWNVKSKIYHDRLQKTKAYDLLLAKYKEMYPDAKKEDVKRKFNILRTNYRKELKKYIHSMKHGGSTYKPSLWYFDEMNFLHNQDVSLDSAPKNVEEKSRTNGLDEEPKVKQCLTVINQNESRDTTHTAMCAQSKKARQDDRMNLTYERLNEDKDEYYHWAMACAADLRKMENTQRLYAKRAIAEVIMEGQLGLLHRHSVKVNAATPSTVSEPLKSVYRLDNNVSNE
ncbi:uncharacterized protein LOC113510053 [Galleria mellonella]|uniref:Uncharacterized protein LOC113510053 n=1 Tax=Galleria mellonella TaxID=7137 RepID=A0A6J1WGK7_GALME|nr:uncharacterized protein LOC113510053 [Galleria mellonella]